LGIHLLRQGVGRLLQLLGQAADARQVAGILDLLQFLDQFLDRGAVVGGTLSPRSRSDFSVT
jgi:hypothetical protein